MAMLKPFLASLAAFIVLDGLWLGLVMKTFYQVQLKGLARFGPDGGFAPVWSAAAPVYLLLALGAAVFAAPRAASTVSAAGWGALLGLVVYGVYDLTNYSTLAQWPLAVTVADILWGMCACGAAAMVAFAAGAR